MLYKCLVSIILVFIIFLTGCDRDVYSTVWELNEAIRDKDVEAAAPLMEPEYKARILLPRLYEIMDKTDTKSLRERWKNSNLDIIYDADNRARCIVRYSVGGSNVVDTLYLVRKDGWRVLLMDERSD